MRIKYAGGATERIVDAYRWGPENGRVCEIADREMVRELLTQPGVDFVVAPDDPLALLIGQEKAAELALEDVQTPSEWRAWSARKEQLGERIVNTLKGWRAELVRAPDEEVDMGNDST